MPARKRVGSVLKGKRLHSPKSPRDWRAWYESPKGSPCPNGTHRAPAYNKIKSSKRFCVRDCDSWSPSKSKGKGGRCFKPAARPRQQTAWQAVLADVRQAAKPMTDRLKGIPKRDAMKEIMIDAGEIYTKVLGKGATLAQYRAKRAEILRAIN